MPLNSTEQQYGTVARFFHWGLTGLILILLATGLLSDTLPKPAGILFHKALGITVLGLALARLIWSVLDRTRPHNSDGGIRDLVAVVVKYLLVILTVLIPITGWLLSSAGGWPISFFGLFTIPPLLAPDKGLTDIFESVHEAVTTLLMALLALHTAGALFHHFVLKDDVLARMIPRLRKH